MPYARPPLLTVMIFPFGVAGFGETMRHPAVLFMSQLLVAVGISCRNIWQAKTTQVYEVHEATSLA